MAEILSQKNLQKRKDLIEKEKQAKFLNAFLTTGSVKEASTLSKIPEKEHYRWKIKDSEYYQKYINAYDSKNDQLLNCAYQVVKETLEFDDLRKANMAQFVMRNLGHATNFNEKNVHENRNLNVNANITQEVSLEQGRRIAEAFLYESGLRQEIAVDLQNEANTSDTEDLV